MNEGMALNIRESLSLLFETALPREETAQRIARLIRMNGGYRWVGLYDVGAELVSMIAFDGPGAPAFRSFSKDKGLTGAAIQEKASVVVGDVREDRRYLTAFGSTLSEAIVPIIDPKTQTVVGTIDVESAQARAFTARDIETLEDCAVACRTLWLRQ